MCLPDIKPETKLSSLECDKYIGCNECFDINDVAPIVGMSTTFIRKAIGVRTKVYVNDVLRLLNLDAFGETFIPRSMVIDYLLRSKNGVKKNNAGIANVPFELVEGDALEKIRSFSDKSVNCVVTSTPYWGLRLYKDSFFVRWGDGELCPFGHEQTPESFIRHSVEVLSALYNVLTDDGSVWWNIMDSFNTRTQIRGSSAEALQAMQGKDSRGWADHACRRYSAGHSYLKDGEQCMIPSRIAERASRVGYYVKAVITWAKTSSLPEPQTSRVSRNLEYVLHLTKVRTPKFDKEVYRSLPSALGGRNNGSETDKLSDVWVLPTSNGRHGHGAQFPVALPARCIALATNANDLVLDPFVGAGNSAIAALALKRKFIGIDTSSEYIDVAKKRIKESVFRLSVS
uniref:Methyltransferase n=1 Tax=Nitratidesulfovibrio vulgaris (strain DSM 19637 / Miyazaki F) TaxID=883 RepID=B8DPA1_NITV9